MSAERLPGRLFDLPPREVGGVRVVSDTPTPAPMKARDGSPILWEQTRTLTLADGSVVYGCKHCDYTSSNVRSIRPHLSKHSRRSNGNAGVEGMSVSDLLTKLGDVQVVTAERDGWKRRALSAEKKLRTLRNALGVDQ